MEKIELRPGDILYDDETIQRKRDNYSWRTAVREVVRSMAFLGILSSGMWAGMKYLPEDIRDFFRTEPVQAYEITIEKPVLSIEILEGIVRKGVVEEKQVREKARKPLNQEEVYLLARLMEGEGSVCSEEERVAMVYTVLNRMALGGRYGKSVEEVATQPRQYSCFNKRNLMGRRLKDPMKHNPQGFSKNLELAEGILKGEVEDPTNGATHYHLNTITPKWTKLSHLQKIGAIKTSTGESRHIFYRDARVSK